MRQERKWPLGKSVHTQEFVSSPNSWDKAKLLFQNEQASKVKTNAFFGVQTSSPIITNPFDSVEIHSPPLAEYHTPPTLTRRSWPHKLRKTRKAGNLKRTGIYHSFQDLVQSRQSTGCVYNDLHGSMLLTLISLHWVLSHRGMGVFDPLHLFLSALKKRNRWDADGAM